MSSKGVIVSLILVIMCIQGGQSIICYDHDLCLGDGCEDIVNLNRTRTCDSNQSHCWKLVLATGTKRGCGDGECKFQVDPGTTLLANVCCSRDYCNSATQFQKLTSITFLLSFIALIIRSY